MINKSKLINNYKKIEKHVSKVPNPQKKLDSLDFLMKRALIERKFRKKSSEKGQNMAN